MTRQLNEGLDYHDMKGQLEPVLSIDEYAAKVGEDSDIITLAFIVHSDAVGEDLVNWLEIGYDFILDASVSEGELESGKWLVFVELERRHSAPEKIHEILEDLKTLTDLSAKDWKIKIDDRKHDASIESMKKNIILSPREYKNTKENLDDLNEMRRIANLDNVNAYSNIDDEIRKYIMNAGL